MRVKEIVVEDFINFKHPAMFIASATCDWKCCKDAGIKDVCQNKELADAQTINLDDEVIHSMFVSNDITTAVVIGGLEPLLQFDEVVHLIKYFRNRGTECPFIIYTGYYENEVQDKIEQLKFLDNIIVKFGRYIPNCNTRFDPLLGITLASENQYAKVISPPKTI